MTEIPASSLELFHANFHRPASGFAKAGDILQRLTETELADVDV